MLPLVHFVLAYVQKLLQEYTQKDSETKAGSRTTGTHTYKVCLAGAITFSSQSVLTKFDKQHARCGHRSLGVGGHALEVAGISGVQVANAEAWAIWCGAERDPPRLLHDRGVVLQPPHSWRRVARHTTHEISCLAQRGGDVVHGSIKSN